MKNKITKHLARLVMGILQQDALSFGAKRIIEEQSDQLLSLFQKEVEDLRKFPSLTNDHNETLDEYDERKSYNQALSDLLEELKKG